MIHFNIKEFIYHFAIGILFTFAIYSMSCYLTSSHMFESPYPLANFFLGMNFGFYAYTFGKALDENYKYFLATQKLS